MTFSQMEENLVYTMCINIYIQLYGKLGVIPLHRDLGKLEPISKVEALIRDASLSWQMQKYHDNGNKGWDVKA